MYRFIWLVPLLPLLGAAINGLLGRRLRFSERTIAAIAVGTVALSFIVSVAAIVSYGAGSNARWPLAYLTSESGGFKYTWISGGPVEVTQGAPERARASAGTPNQVALTSAQETAAAAAVTTPTSDPPGLGKRAEIDGRKNEQTGRSASLDIEWSYQLDPLSAVFMLIVTGVGLCIFVFATGYMRGDPGYYRFFAFLGLFMFMMLVLVMGSNFMMMFVGWEGVGLCSYLLIGYYFDRKEAGDAARKAFIVNRIGDFGFALAVFGVIATFGTSQYVNVVAQAAGYPIELIGHWGIMSWIALGLFVGACGKSAQIPLYVWLPDAMAGPTPVSALIHAATMVTAGLYMLTRTNVIFQHSQTMMLVVAVVGVATALFAATIGITQNDIKKVLAYSTVSQLGFMFVACGVGAFVIGVFHVMTHAFFKALMFLGAGSVIHGMHHEQDMRRMGGLKKYMPKTYWTFLAGWLAICGIIPFSGFWSKDEILWNAASTTSIPYGWIIWLVATIAATCTAFYMTRLVAMTFWGKEKFLEPKSHEGEHEPHDDAHAHGAHDEHDHGPHIPHESPPSMWIPLAVLAVLAVIGGFVGISPAFTGGHHVGGRANIVNWLQPVIWNPQTGGFGKVETAENAAEPAPNEGAPAEGATREGASREAAATEESSSVYGATGFNLAHAIEHKFGGHTAAEWFFIVVSLIVAGLGILLGLLFYVWRPQLPDIWAARLRPLYQASFHKYWIDEIYGLLFTRRTSDAARAVYEFDRDAIDGAVNGTAWLTRTLSRLVGGIDRYFVDGIVNAIAGFIKSLMSPLLRAAQTGFAANYALVMVLGLVIAVAIFFGNDIVIAVKSAFAFLS